MVQRFGQTAKTAASPMINMITFKRILHATTMAYIVIGMFYFYMLSDFSYTVYAQNVSYYSFDKGMAFLLVLCIIFPLREVFKEWICIGSFFVIRSLWEILAIKDYATATRPSIIFVLFIFATLCLIIILLMKIKRRQK